jgi:hypothetical protein
MAWDVTSGKYSNSLKIISFLKNILYLVGDSML